ncbi:hypothetical protein [Kitasatospora sp. LaBMicrA B282]|uniref:hypothetical protein n=1 Tax=Kitasatospora sp. LaBMicrA B282 TaxID=3420949 RepID=UPI003D110774
MTSGDGGRSGGGLTGVLIVLALGALIGLLFVEHGNHDSAPGTGPDPAVISLPQTVEQKRMLDRDTNARDNLDEAGLRNPGEGLPGLTHAVYGDAPGTPGIWVVLISGNQDGRASDWLTANSPAAPAGTVTHPQLRIAGTASCQQDRQDSRTTCSWYDANDLLVVAGPAGAEAVQQVLLRIHDGTEH